MPVYQSIAFRKTPDGDCVAFPAQLHQAGPTIEIVVEQQTLLAQRLLKAGGKAASPVSGIALVDTGATFTSIDIAVTKKLWLQPIGIARVGTAGGPVEQGIFPVKLTLTGSSIPPLELQAIGCDLTGQTILGAKESLIALLGRDFLAKGILIYNGQAGSWSFSI